MATKMTQAKAEQYADDVIGDAYGTVTIMGSEFGEWDAYKRLDPTGARMTIHDYIDAQIEDGEWVVVVDGDDLTTVCDGCAVIILNDDWSALEGGDPEDWESAQATIEAFLEEHGVMLMAGEDDTHDGYWNCPCCGDVTIGRGVSFAER